MSIKRLNNLKRVILDSGLELIDSGPDGIRWYAVAQAKNGETARFTFAKKEGDLRADLNESAKIKRFAHGNDVTTDLPNIPAPTDKDVAIMVKKKMHLVQQEAVEPPQPTPAPTPAPEPEQPASEPASTPRGMAVGTKQHRLKRPEFYKLTKLLEPMETLQFPTLDALAKHATVQLGFLVTKYSVADALEAVGKTTGVQQSRLTPKGSKGGTAINVLARSLCTLFEHLGEPVPDDLKRLVK